MCISVVNMDSKLIFLFILSAVSQIKGVQFYKTINKTRQVVDVNKICTEKKQCLAKCCGLDEVLVVNNGITNCNRTNEAINYKLIQIFDHKTNETITYKTIPDIFTIVYSDWFMANEGVSAYFTVKDDSLYDTGEWETMQITQETRMKVPKLDFCFDLYKGRKPIIRYRPSASEDDLDPIMLIPYVAMYISAFLLLINFIIYCILPDLLIMEMMRAAYVAGMTLSYTFKASIDLSMMMGYMPTSRIQIVAPMTYFITLSSFTWLSIMSLDIWWTLRGTRKHRKIHNKGIKHKFGVYCIYGYGFPALMTIAAVTVDFIETIPKKLKPKFEYFFSAASRECVLYYLHVPLLILIILNWILFFMTVYNIWMVKRGLSRLNSTETRNTRENQYTFKIYLKLSLVMGISWVFDIMQSIEEIPYWFKLTMDIYHGFSGVLIFYIFVFEKSVITRLEKRIGIKLHRKRGPNNGSLMTQVSENSRRGQSKPSVSIFDVKSEQTDKPDVTRC